MLNYIKRIIRYSSATSKAYLIIHQKIRLVHLINLVSEKYRRQRVSLSFIPFVNQYVQEQQSWSHRTVVPVSLRQTAQPLAQTLQAPSFVSAIGLIFSTVPFSFTQRPCSWHFLCSLNMIDCFHELIQCDIFDFHCCVLSADASGRALSIIAGCSNT